MDDHRETGAQAESAAMFRGGRAACWLAAVGLFTADGLVAVLHLLGLPVEMPGGIHGLVLIAIVLLVDYAMTSWQVDRALLPVRRDRAREDAATRALLGEILGEVRAARARREEDSAEMRAVEERVTKLVEAGIARLDELAKTMALHGKAMAALHNDIDELKTEIAAATDRALNEVVRVLAESRQALGQIAHRVERVEASTADATRQVGGFRAELREMSARQETLAGLIANGPGARVVLDISTQDAYELGKRVGETKDQTP